MWLVTCLLALAALPRDGEVEVRAALARLAAESSVERASAERWLAAHLEVEHFALAAEAAKQGGLETRARLAHALGSDDRHFELAVLFELEVDPELSGVGRKALQAALARWFEYDGAELDPLDERRIADELRGSFFGTYSIRPFAAPPDETLDRLARHAPERRAERERDAPFASFAIVVDPAFYVDALAGKLVAPQAAGDPRLAGGLALEGEFDELLFDLAHAYRGALDGFGFAGQHPWVRIADPSDVGEKGGARLLIGWCRDVVQYPDRPRGEGAARALAASAWPAALAWLEKRWQRNGDANALSGLLLAAGRGRVAPSLASERAVAQLCERALRPANDADTQLRRLQFAYARVPRLGADGSDLARAVERAVPGLFRVPRETLLCAGILAGMGYASQRVRDDARRLLATGQPLAGGFSGAPAEFARQELALVRMLARAGAPGERWAIAGSPELLDAVTRAGAEPQFLGDVETLRARPDDSLANPAAARELAQTPRLLLIEWWLVSEGGAATAGSLVADWLATSAPELPLAARLAERVQLGDGERVRAALAAAGAGASAAVATRLERIELLAGAIDTARRAELGARLLGGALDPEGRVEAAAVLRFEDWPLVGVLAGEQDGERARAYLLEHAERVARVEKSLDAPWIDACARALRGLRARDDAAALHRMLSRLKTALRTSAHPLLARIEAGLWPPYPGARALGLEALDLCP